MAVKKGKERESNEALERRETFMNVKMALFCIMKLMFQLPSLIPLLILV